MLFKTTQEAAPLKPFKPDGTLHESRTYSRLQIKACCTLHDFPFKHATPEKKASENIYLQKLSWAEIPVCTLLCLSQCLWQVNRLAKCLPSSKHRTRLPLCASEVTKLASSASCLTWTHLTCSAFDRYDFLLPATWLHAPVETRHTSCEILQHELKAVKKKKKKPYPVSPWIGHFFFPPCVLYSLCCCVLQTNDTC